jgi:hypothetical protein
MRIDAEEAEIGDGMIFDQARKSLALILGRLSSQHGPSVRQLHEALMILAGMVSVEIDSSFRDTRHNILI